jgi:hypothetical protein
MKNNAIGQPIFEASDAVTTDITGQPALTIRRANMLLEKYYEDKTTHEIQRLAMYFMNGFELGLKKAKDQVDLEFNKYQMEKEQLRRGIAERWKKTATEQSKK